MDYLDCRTRSRRGLSAAPRIDRPSGFREGVSGAGSYHLLITELAKLNFELAYKRVCDELVEQHRTGRAFVSNPFERELAETDLDSWLADLQAMVVDGTYAPGAVELCGAPKGGDLIRPGARMALADRVVYTAAVGACVGHIVRNTKWSQRITDFAPLFHATRPHQQRWLLQPYLGWKLWTERSLHLLHLARTQHVVTADIAGFFENVSLRRLRSDLVRIECSDAVIDLLSACLNKWALVHDRGLPQGVLASDVLAKLYLESFDKRLKVAGHTHVRYADDVRVFCRSYPEARRALVLVTELLRERGLTVQSAKTKIRDADNELQREIEGAVPAIRNLNRDFIHDAIDADVIPEEMGSVPVSVIDDLINADPSQMDPEVIRRAWQQFVLDAERPNRSMVRYLLRRFATRSDPIAVEYCAPRLRSHPEDATEILRYFEDLADPKLEVPIARALSSRDLRPYPYSRFLLLDWLRRNRTDLRAVTLKAVREQAFGESHPQYVQAAARAVLGAMGEHSDLDRLASLLPSTSDPFARAQLVCTLTKLERGRRNGLAAPLKDEKPWGTRAWTYVRTAH